MLTPSFPGLAGHPVPVIAVLAALSWLFLIARGLPGMARHRWAARVAIALYTAAVAFAFVAIAFWLARGGR